MSTRRGLPLEIHLVEVRTDLSLLRIEVLGEGQDVIGGFGQWLAVEVL